MRSRQLLDLDPDKRVTAKRAMESLYFVTKPVLQCDADGKADVGRITLPEGGNFHEFQTKKRRREAKAAAEEKKKER